MTAERIDEVRAAIDCAKEEFEATLQKLQATLGSGWLVVPRFERFDISGFDGRRDQWYVEIDATIWSRP